MVNNTIVILGMMCSGKTTLAKELEKRGYNRIVTYTTRKPREGEVDGIDYHFISTKKFMEMYRDKVFAEFTMYDKDDEGIVFYASAKEDYNKQNGVIVLNAVGVYDVASEDSGVSADFIYLDIPDSYIYDRVRDRGDLPSEVVRRVEADRKDFNSLFASGFKPTLTFEGEMPVEHMADYIETKIWKMGV